MKYPIEVNEIVGNIKKSTYRQDDIGKYVSIRPVKSVDNDGTKTYLGIYLGDLPVSVYHMYDKDSKKLTAAFMHNPAIFVPSLNKIVYGYESWWGIIKSADDLKQITDADVQNVWYVKALAELSK